MLAPGKAYVGVLLCKRHKPQLKHGLEHDDVFAVSILLLLFGEVC
jgi:hypothetical protein